MKRRTAALFAGLLLAVLGVFTGGGTASASNVTPTHPGTVAPLSLNEVSYATASSGPPAGAVCIASTGSTACFVANGDNWYVKDTVADSLSASAIWSNYHGSSLYRAGRCVNRLGNGHWGTCNKDYVEGTEIDFVSCRYDSTASNPSYLCSDKAIITHA